MPLSSSSADRRIPEALSTSRERNLTVEAPGWSALGPSGDGQPVQELSWLTAHGRVASVDTHESHCFSRMPPSSGFHRLKAKIKLPDSTRLSPLIRSPRPFY